MSDTHPCPLGPCATCDDPECNGDGVCDDTDCHKHGRCDKRGAEAVSCSMSRGQEIDAAIDRDIDMAMEGR